MKNKLLLLILLLTLTELESDTVIFKSGKSLENVKAKLRGSDVDVQESATIKKTYSKSEIKSIVYSEVTWKAQEAGTLDTDGTIYHSFNGKNWGRIKTSSNWTKASKVCQSKSAKLPSIRELTALYGSNLPWRKEACPYPCDFWSIEYDSEKAHVVSMENGDETIMLKSLTKNVLCVKN